MYKVLIADDEELERKVLKLFIEKSSLPFSAVLLSEDGKDAVIKALCDKPDIIILDINMPELSGLEVLEKIRDAGSIAKVIISTAFDQFDYAIQALRLGALDFLVKPVKKEVLLTTITKAIERIEKEKSKDLKIENLNHMVNSMSDKDNRSEERSDVNHIPHAIELVKTYIEEHYKDNIGLDEIIDDCGYSKYHISRLFKSYQNCTIMEYLVRHRMSMAKKLLKNTKCSVKDIALSVGFNDPNYFSLIFKRELSVTPMMYRAVSQTQEENTR